MGRRFAVLVFLLTVASAASCEDAIATFSSRHFNFEAYEGVPTNAIIEVQQALENNRSRILADLGLEDLPVVNVKLWGSVRDFGATLTDAAPAEAGRVLAYFVMEGDIPTIRLLYDGSSATRAALHQFTHIASLSINPDFANNPRWLWEAVALFEAKQFFPPSQLSCVTLSDVPSLGQLDAPVTNPTIIHRLGYLLAEFIVTKFGQEALAELIRAEGDTKAVLGIDAIDFERDWHRFVTNGYLSDGRIPPILNTEQVMKEVAGNTFYLEDGRSFYFAPNRDLYMEMGDVVQTGRWFTEGGTKVCWQILNFDAFCSSFRMSSNRFWLDTVADCNRYSLRRAQGNAEGY